jgi:hypothetical protein
MRGQFTLAHEYSLALISSRKSIKSRNEVNNAMDKLGNRIVVVSSEEPTAGIGEWR